MIRNRNHAFTLIEVMIVTGIIGILAGTLWLVLGPQAKLRGLEVRVGNDLRQFSMAVNLYMSEHDGEYPNWPRDLAKGTPLRLDGWQAFKGCSRYYNAGTTSPDYYLTFHYFARLAEYGHKPRTEWDPTVQPIVRSPLVRRGKVADFDIYYDCFKPPVRMSQEEFKIYSGWLDGHVSWFSNRNSWFEENTACVSQGVGR